MKRESSKHRQRRLEAAQWRAEFLKMVGRCDVCGRRQACDVDEIARGPDRQKALDKEFAVLAVCRLCHGLCQDWSRARRLALLYLRRSDCYDLDAYHKIVARCFPGQEEVDAEIEKLLTDGVCSGVRRCAA